MNEISRVTMFVILVILFLNSAFSETITEDYASKDYSLNAGESYSENVYWGDTHLHSNLSFDAYSRKNKFLG